MWEMYQTVAGISRDVDILTDDDMRKGAVWIERFYDRHLSFASWYVRGEEE